MRSLALVLCSIDVIWSLKASADSSSLQSLKGVWRRESRPMRVTAPIAASPWNKSHQILQ